MTILGASRADGRCRFGRKGEPASFDVACNERVQTRLEDRDLPVLEVPDLRCIPIDTDYDVPKIRKACAGHEPDVAGTHHCYSHEMLSGVLPLATFSTRSRTIFLRRYGSETAASADSLQQGTSFARPSSFCSLRLRTPTAHPRILRWTAKSDPRQGPFDRANVGPKWPTL